MQRLSILIILIMLLAFHVKGQRSFTLEEAIEYGLENQTAIKSADLDIANSEHDIKEIKSIGLPKVNGGIDYSYFYYVPQQPIQDFISPAVYGILEAEGLPTTTQMPPQTFNLAFVQPHQLTAGVSANMLAFDGAYIYGLKAARLYRELVVKQKDATATQIRANITKAYLAILIAQENRTTIENNMTTLKQSLDEVSAMYEAGFMESLDVDRLRLSYDNLSTQLESIDGLIELSKNLLKFQMNYPINEDISITEDIDALVLTFGAEENISSIEIDPNQRTEYQVLNKSQELNEIDLKRNKAGYYPSAALFTSFQYQLLRRNLFDSDEAGWIPNGVVGININVPIYDGGEKSAKIQKVKVNMERVNLQLDQFSTAMTLEVQNAQIAIRNAKKDLANKRAALALNESIYDRTKIKFREGVGSSVEVTQAETSLYNAQSAVISALYDLLQAKVDLDIALGKI